MLGSFTGSFKFGRRRRLSLLPAGYVTLAGLTWAPMTTGGTYAQSQTYAENFTGLGSSAGTWRSATVAELQSLTAVLSYADAQSVYGWVFSSHAYNIWTSESGRVAKWQTIAIATQAVITALDALRPKYHPPSLKGNLTALSTC